MDIAQSSRASQEVKNRELFTTACVAGLAAGTLDGLAAVLLFLAKGGKNPVAIFNFIASGVFGQAGLKGGLGMAFLGLLFHYMIATIWAFIFLYACTLRPGILRHWLWAGVGYGVLVWMGMNLVVVPLSLTPPLPSSPGGIIKGIAVLMICVGVPIAFVARKKFHA